MSHDAFNMSEMICYICILKMLQKILKEIKLSCSKKQSPSAF